VSHPEKENHRSPAEAIIPKTRQSLNQPLWVGKHGEWNAKKTSG
jgi:hypothetical protein